MRLCDGETEKGQCDGDFGDDTGENIGCLAKPPPLLNLSDTETGVGGRTMSGGENIQTWRFSSHVL